MRTDNHFDIHKFDEIHIDSMPIVLSPGDARGLSAPAVVFGGDRLEQPGPLLKSALTFLYQERALLIAIKIRYTGDGNPNIYDRQEVFRVATDGFGFYPPRPSFIGVNVANFSQGVKKREYPNVPDFNSNW
jgi:hypothetical protein